MTVQLHSSRRWQTDWRMNCVHAPLHPSARHCQQFNEGEKSTAKALARKGNRPVGKGNFGCARKCSYFKLKEGKK